MSLSTYEEKILESIVVRSENDPYKPEFPFEKPIFPASSTYQINVPGFHNVRFKDESTNPTGTHKDRMAWEMVVTYRDFLEAKKIGLRTGNLPQMSIISSGSAAFAIQSALARFGLPSLKVLVDIGIDKAIEEALLSIGCEIYHTDLSRKNLSSWEILQITHNQDGLDITDGGSLGAGTRYYDWLSYEIVNISPEWCFVPFGTGNLYENILNVCKKEIECHSGNDPRFSGNVDVLRKCNFMGATSNNPKTIATKLYSPFLPFVHFDDQWLKAYKFAGYCGDMSDVVSVQESFLLQALDILAQQGIGVEPSGAAGLALLLQMKTQIPPNAKILIVSTGKTKNDVRFDPVVI